MYPAILQVKKSSSPEEKSIQIASKIYPVYIHTCPLSTATGTLRLNGTVWTSGALLPQRHHGGRHHLTLCLPAALLSSFHQLSTFHFSLQQPTLESNPFLCHLARPRPSRLAWSHGATTIPRGSASAESQSFRVDDHDANCGCFTRAHTHTHVPASSTEHLHNQPKLTCTQRAQTSTNAAKLASTCAGFFWAPPRCDFIQGHFVRKKSPEQ